MSPLRSARDISDNVSNTATVTIHLRGGEKRRWCLQKNLLRHHSPYFRKRLHEGTDDETLDGLEILRPDEHLDSPQPFELVVQYLYIGAIDDVPEKSPDGQHAPYNMFTYIRLWYLCDKTRFDMPALQALALARMADYHRIYAVTFDAPKVEYIYKHTGPSSPLRELAARDAAYEFMRRAPATRLRDGRFGDKGFEYMSENGEFALDVLYAIRSGLGSRTLPHAFESHANGDADGDADDDADGDVFTDRGDRTGSAESRLKTTMSAYTLNIPGANGPPTPSPTPDRNSVANERVEEYSSAESSGSPSRATDDSANQQVSTPTKADAI